MLKLSLKSKSTKTKIPNLDRCEVEIECPICRLHSWVRLGEIRRRDFLICRGCHANILLEDHLGSLQKIIRTIEKKLRGILKWNNY